MRKLTTAEFISKARLVHGDKYDYSKVNYVKSTTKVCIICPKHGEFWQRPNDHLSGRGCMNCKTEGTKRAIYGVGINDSKTPISRNGKDFKSYNAWLAMISRCYNPNELNKRPTYKYCIVCDSWLKYSNFKKWFDKNYKEGYQLDKDILVQGNLTYSPQTCCFVPQYINSFINDCAKSRGRYKLGVIKDGRKYYARTHIDGVLVNLGTFESEDDAHIAYKNARKKEISRVANEYYNKGAIDRNVYEALLKREIYEY